MITLNFFEAKKFAMLAPIPEAPPETIIVFFSLIF